MKKSLFFLALLSSSMFLSCSNEENIIIGGGSNTRHDSPFKIEIESVSVPESVTLFYSSPDPGCGLPYRYEIFTDYEEKEVVLKCTNIANLSVDLSKSFIGESIILPEDKEWAEVKDGNCIVLHLPSIELTDETTSSTTFSEVYISAETDSGSVWDFILIERYPAEYMY